MASTSEPLSGPVPGAASDPALPSIQGAARPRSIEWVSMIPFGLVHLGALAAFWVDFSWSFVGLALATYWIRMFAITAGYHRYFSHRAFKTSRVFQFILAFVAQTTSQRGVLWWAAHHRNHHRWSDTPRDVHSPRQDGFLYSQFLWIWSGNSDTQFDRVRDLARFPELRFLDQVWWMPPWVLAFACYFIGGVPGLVWGFFVSTVFTWHCTFTINSLTHVYGKPRFDTGDDSRNNGWLALITMGEGWHNNHHYYQASVRQGFYWWEHDATFYILWVLSKMRIVWDLRPVPRAVLDKGREMDARRQVH